MTDVLDLLRGDSSGYRGLYYLWEQEQWEAGKIELGPDAQAWAALDPIGRRRVSLGVDWRRFKAELATTALVSFVDAAPIEEQQVFLTTQLADEARAGVFLDRVATEVFGAPEPEMGERSAGAERALPPDLAALLNASLPAVAARLRASQDAARDLVDGVARYHLCVVGAFGLTELEHSPAAAGVHGLRGLERGLDLIRRDSTRHAAFAVRFVEETSGSGPANRALETALNATLPMLPESFAALAHAAPGELSAEELHARARDALSAWLRAVNVSLPALA